MMDRKTANQRGAPKYVRQLALVDFDINKYPLPDEQATVFRYLVCAADLIDKIFWKQSCPDADVLKRRFKEKLLRDPELARFFEINYGPYDRLANDRPFLPVGPKPLGAGFYPPDLTKGDFLKFIERHPQERKSIQSAYSLIRRKNDGLYALPYHVAYADEVNGAASFLSKAATAQSNGTMGRYLEMRAKALKSDDYYESDVEWIDLPPHGLDVTIGPYEVYEDKLIGIKAAYEAMITYQDPLETQRVRGLLGHVGEFHKYLINSVGLDFDPPGPSIPINVGDLLYSAGDARKGIPAIGFSLPNDERVIQEKGSKQVILRNVLRAKLDHVLLPICRAAHGEEFDPEKTFEGLLTYTVLHEISHALGPHQIKVAGEITTVNRALRDLHMTLEELKADVLAAYWLVWMSGGTAGNALPDILKSYLPGLIRAVRFGLGEAHGRSNLIQFNYLLECGAIQISDDGWPFIVPSILDKGLRTLAEAILRIQFEGNYEAAERMIRKYCQPTRITHDLARKLEHLPVDITIRFSSLGEN